MSDALTRWSGQHSPAAIADPELRRAAIGRATSPGILEFDGHGRVAFLDEQARWWLRLGTAEDAPDLDMTASVHPDDRQRLLDDVDEALDPQGDGRIDAFFRLTSSDPTASEWRHLRGDVHFDDGRPVRLAGTIQEAPRAGIERRLETRMKESQHRISNALASAHAIAGLSRSGAGDVDEYHNRLTSRLRALAGAHNLLHETGLAAAQITDVLTRSQASFVGATSEQVEFHGDDFLVPADLVATFAMAFHELLMNAAKHGALTTDTGRIRVVVERGKETTRLLWQEIGPPAAAEPLTDGTGYGSILLLHALPEELGGRAEINAAETFAYTLDFPNPERG